MLDLLQLRIFQLQIYPVKILVIGVQPFKLRPRLRIPEIPHPDLLPQNVPEFNTDLERVQGRADPSHVGASPRSSQPHRHQRHLGENPVISPLRVHQPEHVLEYFTISVPHLNEKVPFGGKLEVPESVLLGNPVHSLVFEVVQGAHGEADQLA